MTASRAAGHARRHRDARRLSSEHKDIPPRKADAIIASSPMHCFTFCTTPRAFFAVTFVRTRWTPQSRSKRLNWERSPLKNRKAEPVKRKVTSTKGITHRQSRAQGRAVFAAIDCEIQHKLRHKTPEVVPRSHRSKPVPRLAQANIQLSTTGAKPWPHQRKCPQRRASTSL